MRTRSHIEIEGLRVRIARSFAARLVGLLGRRALATDEALLLAPCNNVHTLFMRFVIDVVFLDREGTIVAIKPAVRPWRMAWAPRAHSCLELAEGAAARLSLQVGQRLPQLAACH